MIKNKKIILVDAIYINSGGGKVLLEYLIDNYIYYWSLGNILKTLEDAPELKSSISVSTSSTLSVRGVSSTFRKMTVTANFELTKQGSGDVLLQDTVTADATLGTVSSLFGQDQSELHARDRMATFLAQRVAQRVQLYFLENNWPSQAYQRT